MPKKIEKIRAASYPIMDVSPLLTYAFAMLVVAGKENVPSSYTEEADAALPVTDCDVITSTELVLSHNPLYPKRLFKMAQAAPEVMVFSIPSGSRRITCPFSSLAQIFDTLARNIRGDCWRYRRLLVGTSISPSGVQIVRIRFKSNVVFLVTERGMNNPDLGSLWSNDSFKFFPFLPEISPLTVGVF